MKQALIEDTHTCTHMRTRDSAGRSSLCCFRKRAGRQLARVGGISRHYWKTSSGKFGPQDWKEGLRGVRENTAGSGDNSLLPRDASQLTVKSKAPLRLFQLQRDCDGGHASAVPHTTSGPWRPLPMPGRDRPPPAHWPCPSPVPWPS
ncbi:hypothetical protein mRhiFer1_007997 [Rhinolophus ferrumequinum]|uniref:Uncharacterized protein n=1 Tax=Rhinolophus ferrumequinum TaxID=59479 RepID=A0A7J7WR76_RHIFE|nr:hypothetical protein mRhiFer1_007997 [Rhinolophus ferrumequinum]